MSCGDFVGAYDGTCFIKIPIGEFIRKRFYSGKSLSECYTDYEREYGGYGFEKGRPFNPLTAAAMIRRDWYRLKRLNHLPPGEGGVTLDILLDRPRTARGGNRCPLVKQGGR
jgi:hypothetical protein